jgi:hypothetical protein
MFLPFVAPILLDKFLCTRDCGHKIGSIAAPFPDNFIDKLFSGARKIV